MLLMHQRASVLTHLLKARKCCSSHSFTHTYPSCNAPLCGRFFTRIPIPYLRYFDKPLGIGRWCSAARHWVPPLLLDPSAPFPLANLCRLLAKLREIIGLVLPRRYCLSYDSCPLPTSYFSALQKRLLSGVSTSSIKTTAAGVVDSSTPNSNLVSAMMMPRSAA